MAASSSPAVPTASHAPMGDGRLWFGLVGGPLAWALHELFGWFFGARVCSSLTIPGVRLVVGGITAAGLALAVAALVVSRASLTRASTVPEPPDTEAWDRRTFMALGGVLISSVSILALFWAGLSAVFLQTCGWIR